MNIIPETAYESYCDGCSEPKLKMTEIKLKEQELGLHYCSHNCFIQLNKGIDEICLSIPSFPKYLEYNKFDYTNRVIYPREEIKNPEKIKLITQLQENLHILIKSGKIERPISSQYKNILIVMASWFSTK